MNSSQPPLISIIVSVSSLKRMTEITNLAENLQKQTYTNIEIVLVKNGIDGHLPIEDLRETSVVRSDTNRGVAGGRNLGISKASGEYVVFIDDDADFSSDNALSDIAELFDRYPDVSAFTFAISNCSLNDSNTDYDHGGYPFRRGKAVKRERECSYFFGGASAFRREVFEIIGFLPEEYFFGCEELDYSFMMMEKNMKIIFSPSVTINHYLSENEEREKQRSYYLIRNRITLVFKYLPLRYAFCHSFLWTIFVFIESVKNRSFIFFINGLFDGIRNVSESLKSNKTLSKETVKKIKLLWGRIYY